MSPVTSERISRTLHASRAIVDRKSLSCAWSARVRRMSASESGERYRALQRQFQLAEHIHGELRRDIRAVALLLEERLQRDERIVPFLPARRGYMR